MSVSRLSRVDEVYNQLLDLYRAEPEINPNHVIDGWAKINDFADYVVLFGYRPTADAAIDVERATEGLAANDVETVTLGAMVAAVNAKQDMRAARARATEIMAALERVVTTKPRLGLTGVKATISGHTWKLLYTDKGAECDIAVDITVEVTL